LSEVKETEFDASILETYLSGHCWVCSGACNMSARICSNSMLAALGTEAASELNAW